MWKFAITCIIIRSFSLILIFKGPRYFRAISSERTKIKRMRFYNKCINFGTA